MKLFEKKSPEGALGREISPENQKQLDILRQLHPEATKIIGKLKEVSDSYKDATQPIDTTILREADDMWDKLDSAHRKLGGHYPGTDVNVAGIDGTIHCQNAIRDWLVYIMKQIEISGRKESFLIEQSNQRFKMYFESNE